MDGVLGDVHGEGGLAHGGPGGDDDEVGALQAAGHFVQIGVVGGQPGDALAALQQRIDRSERFFDDFLHAHEPAPDTLFGKLHDGRFGVIKNFFGGIALVGGASNGGIGGM